MWKINFDKKAQRSLDGLDKITKSKIISYLNYRVAGNPKSFGKALIGNLKGLWRYRVGDYRIICPIQEEQILILVLDIGHRREVYSK